MVTLDRLGSYQLRTDLSMRCACVCVCFGLSILSLIFNILRLFWDLCMARIYMHFIVLFSGEHEAQTNATI